ncbi:hypothetical protein [Microbulbifer litoralis]|uniref:hypothetical protein n=1 Tax=Microbulbifer litoralis TaxID=2933965 RepID=UPI00202922B9|nr:hypothetical protein [Microbulbifer sp. GX H0434]
MKSARYLFPTVLATLAFLTACSDAPPGTVRFSPSTGDTRSYQVHSRSRIRVGAPSLERSLTVDSDTVLRYKVLGTGRTLKLAIEPTYTRFSLDGRTNFSNARADDSRAGNVLRELMSAGFELEIDTETGTIEHFASSNDALWQTVLEDAGGPVVDNLEKQMSPPGVPQLAVPAIEGKTVTLSNFRGADQLQLTVERVTDSEVVTRLEAHGKAMRLQGTMVLERDSGWLKRLALISENHIEQDDIGGSSRQQLLVLPEDSPSVLGSWLLNMRLGGEQGRPFEPAPTANKVADTATAEQVLPVPVGSLVQTQDWLLLQVGHDLGRNAFPGRFDLEDLQLQGADGEPLPLELFRMSRYDFFDPDAGKHSTMARYVPLGWDNAGEQLEKIGQITATGHYQALDVEAVTLPLDGEKATEVTLHGARAEAIPTDNPREFRLRLQHTGTHHFSSRIHGLEEARGIQPDGEWLSAEEREILRLVALGHYALGDIRMVFSEQVPDELTLYLLSDSDRQPFDYQLRFVTEAAMRNDLSLPPTTEVPLYENADGDDTADIALGELELPQPQNNQLALELPASLVGSCQPTVVEAPDIDGHPLVWRRLTENATNNNQLGTTQQWQLSTEDGIRHYFYGLEIEHAIRCKGRSEWRAVPISLGDRPWLVEPTQLGDQFDPHQPIADFLQRYRFIGTQGWPLAPVPPNSEVSLSASTVGDYLTRDGLLRLAGEVQRVEQRVFTGEPEERLWSTDFQPLP